MSTLVGAKLRGCMLTSNSCLQTFDVKYAAYQTPDKTLVLPEDLCDLG